MKTLAKLAPMPDAGPSGKVAAIALGLLAAFVAAALFVRKANEAQSIQLASQAPWGR